MLTVPQFIVVACLASVIYAIGFWRGFREGAKLG